MANLYTKNNYTTEDGRVVVLPRGVNVDIQKNLVRLCIANVSYPIVNKTLTLDQKVQLGCDLLTKQIINGHPPGNLRYNLNQVKIHSKTSSTGFPYKEVRYRYPDVGENKIVYKRRYIGITIPDTPENMNALLSEIDKILYEKRTEFTTEFLDRIPTDIAVVPKCYYRQYNQLLTRKIARLQE